LWCAIAQRTSRSRSRWSWFWSKSPTAKVRWRRILAADNEEAHSICSIWHAGERWLWSPQERLLLLWLGSTLSLYLAFMLLSLSWHELSRELLHSGAKVTPQRGRVLQRRREIVAAVFSVAFITFICYNAWASPFNQVSIHPGS
jgi:hypothetical protein